VTGGGGRSDGPLSNACAGAPARSTRRPPQQTIRPQLPQQLSAWRVLHLLQSMATKVQIRVTEAQRETLYALKNRGDDYSDVVGRLLDAADVDVEEPTAAAAAGE